MTYGYLNLLEGDDTERFIEDIKKYVESSNLGDLSETVIESSSARNWTNSDLSALLKRVKFGDVLVTTSFDELGFNGYQMLDIVKNLALLSASLHIVQNQRVLPGSNPNDGAYLEGLRDFSELTNRFMATRSRAAIAYRTREDGDRNKPGGTAGASKLDPHKEDIRTRIAMGETQTEIAKDLGVHQAHLSRYIRANSLTEPSDSKKS